MIPLFLKNELYLNKIKIGRIVKIIGPITDINARQNILLYSDVNVPLNLDLYNNKIEYINLWYTKEKLNDFNVELEKLHYTNGNFIHRTTNFLNNNLNLPKNEWNFLETKVGIEFDSTNNKLITPIIIKIK